MLIYYVKRTRYIHLTAPCNSGHNLIYKKGKRLSEILIIKHYVYIYLIIKQFNLTGFSLSLLYRLTFSLLKILSTFPIT